jgi:hypothetical protein
MILVVGQDDALTHRELKSLTPREFQCD